MTLNSRKPTGGDVVLESRHLIGLFVVMVVIFGVVFVLGYELGRNQYTQQVHAAASPDDFSAAAQPAAEMPSDAISKPAASSVSGKQSSANTTGGRNDAEGQPATNWDYYKAVDNATPAPHLEKPMKNAPPAPTVAVKSHASLTTSNSAAAAPSGAIASVKPAATSPGSATKNAVAPPSKPQSLDAPLMPRGAILLQVAALTKQSDALAMAQILQQRKFPTIVLPPSTDNFYRVQVGPYRDLESAIAARNALENAGFKSIIKR